MKKIIQGLFLLNLLFLISCHNESDELIIGYFISPPFAFHDLKTFKIDGFSIDLTKLICQEINIKCKFRHIEGKEIPIALWSKNIRIGLDTVMTKKRKELFLFSDSYIINRPCILISEKSLIKDINNLIPGFIIDSSTIDLIENKKKMILYNDYLSLYYALKNNVIDFTILRKNYIDTIMNNNESKDLKIINIKNFNLDEFSYFFIFNLDDIELRNKFNFIINKFKKNGIINQLKRKYHLE